MLDPLSALSVASAVVSFIDFVSDLVKEADAIHDKGSSSRVLYNRIVTSDLISINATLRARNPDRLPPAESLQKEEQALDDIVIECNAIASELIACLDRLMVNNPTNKWQSFRAALRTIWTQSKIDELVSRLDSFRREIGLRILLLLNAKSDIQSRRQTKIFDSLQRSSKDVVEVISIHTSNLQSTIEKHATQAGQFHEEHAAAARKQHEETIAAILTLRDGNTQVIARPRVEDAAIGARQIPGQIQRSHTFSEVTEQSQSEGSPRPPRVTMDNFEPVLKKILDCLYFRQITDRVEEIAPAYERTFQWIFHDPAVKQKPWSNFVDWLHHGTGCYWVNGKAGSGKSTLMKYIQGDVRTHRALHLWAGQDSLVTASFFLWNLGSPLQKSQIGLLRSLLFDVLDRHQGLIPSAFPGLCRSALAEPRVRLSEPSFPELKKAFLNLVNQQNSSLRMCFFIDGIDEYDGDQAELIDLLREISSSSDVKLVLSSRPTSACVEELSDYPSLRLQDLTDDDIRLYVEGKLRKHPNMMKLKTKEPSAAEELTTEICSKASGVFLWVMLVVRSLLRGLRNHDRVSDLRRRLEELPAGLETLYDHMLQTMTPMYRHQASQLFQIVMASLMQTEQPLTLLQASYAEEEDPNDAITAPVALLDQAIELSRYEETEARIRSRCCGLVEVEERRKRREGGTVFTLLHVGFLHKTVVEFLNIEHNWSKMLSLTRQTSFDPHLALMSSCLYMSKTFDLQQTATSAAAEGHSDICRSFLLYAKVLEEKTQEPQTAFMDDFDKTLECLSRTPVGSTIRKTRSGKRKSESQLTGFNKSIIFLALRFGLTLYIKENTSYIVMIAKSEKGAALLREALCQFIYTGAVSKQLKTYDIHYYSKEPGYPMSPQLFFELVEILLEYGADPNKYLPLFEDSPEDGGDLCSPWELALDLAIALRSQHKKFLFDFREGSWSFLFLKILHAFVIHRANPNAVRVSGVYGGSALSIIDGLLTPSWHMQAGTASALSKECQDLIDRTHRELRSLLLKREAAHREWLGGKLITAPPQRGGVKTVLSKKGVSLGSPSLGGSESVTSDASVEQHSRLRSLWTKFVA